MKYVKTLLIVIALSGLLYATGCGGSGAKELLDTATLEEKQNNPEHALKIYQEILEKYPDSKEAKTADERIKALKQ